MCSGVVKDTQQRLRVPTPQQLLLVFPDHRAWEWRDRPLAVFGRKHHGYALALALLNWSKDLVLLRTDNELLIIR